MIIQSKFDLYINTVLHITKLLMCTNISFVNEPSKKLKFLHTQIRTHTWIVIVYLFSLSIYNYDSTIKYSRKNQSWLAKINFCQYFFLCHGIYFITRHPFLLIFVCLTRIGWLIITNNYVLTIEFIVNAKTLRF